MRKILYSPGYGAGWSSWAEGDIAKLMLTYQPIIDAVEAGEELWSGGYFVDLILTAGTAQKVRLHVDTDKAKDAHPALVEFVSDCIEQFNETPYLGGVRDLKVASVNGRVRIDEYDGFESITEEGEDDWI